MLQRAIPHGCEGSQPEKHRSVHRIFEGRAGLHCLGEVQPRRLLTYERVDDVELPSAWLADLAVVLIFSNVSLKPLVFSFRTFAPVVAIGGHGDGPTAVYLPGFR